MRVSICAAAAALVFIAGCQLFVDLDGLEDMHCGPKEKACPNGCVPRNDPATGCNGDSCAPCAPPHAKGTCAANGACAIDSCVDDWKDCDHQYGTGCEIDIAHDAYNCGACDFKCPKPEFGIAGCSNSQCTIGGCNPPYEDCNHQYGDGCERMIWTDQECMGCGMPCPDGTHCSQGVCL
jgi:hypothetical protein